MGVRLPVISGKDLLDFYLKLGCKLKRVKGSHHVVQSIYNGGMFVIPVHSNEEIDRGLLKVIIIQSGLEVEQFMLMWKNK